MKFLFFTDSHIRGTTPKNRKDNFYKTLKNKFHEVKDIAQRLNVDYILHGGDWFDRPDISPSIVREFAVILKGFKRPVYTVAGNHDIYGHKPDTIGRTMLGLLEGTGILNLIGYDDEIILKKDGITVQLTGKAYNYEIDSEQYKKYYVIRKQEGVDYAINIVHGMLLQKPFYEGIQYTLIDDLKDTGADITFAGHYHSGFGIKKIGTRYFVNPGSIVRISSSLAEIGRRPMVVYAKLDEEIYIETIELQTALPGDEVLDREKLEAAKDRTVKLHQFYQSVTATGEYKKIDISELIEEIAANDELGRNVKEEALRRIAIARESFSTGQDEV